jgi:DNA-binding transcriptional LysR family regulator
MRKTDIFPVACCSCANTGVVCLGASQTTGTYLMPRLISLYRQHNQEVALQLQVHPTLPLDFIIWCNSRAGVALITAAAVARLVRCVIIID